MTVAWQWIKKALVLLPWVLVAYLALSVRALEVQKVTAQQSRDQALTVNQVNHAQIQQLVSRNRTMSQLLQQRQQSHITQEAKLHETTTVLRKALATNACYQQPWPDDVIKRLQQPY
ncbi:hypothetical protein [Photobacterium kishitanii]|uniref:hypothetical protein n=1 Tax=Photobacterium kishitanii TaxID=318456 RepID=UPI000D4BA717|nr:hypothetical protein [Photobacterium kishitanii]PSV25692.1 hypothetical protein C0W28_00385 [Photobacterium kishitanii]